MMTNRRSILASLAAAACGAPLAFAQSDAPANIPKNPNYKRIACEEAWTTREIADEYGRFIASNPTDEPGFMALGARYYARGADSPILANMLDLGEGRIAAMNRFGIDMQLLLLIHTSTSITTNATARARLPTLSKRFRKSKVLIVCNRVGH